ncbi:5'-nucleotidase [Gilvimarinus sp. 1_MG-2023]|uniref:5'-nucleotidase n=1 Tax=Gilvimarinus sp. 1_MG-2023 TaxID=3062638 RepID=UPI0026E3656D|nr:5'-nucleotidase [Gilvimarinus sp. 1_MG-2023]MDO6745874.1 5'-nucleotidase [Gilvimarinus sp. 1_MG-2023]
MPETSNKLVIAISSRALFNLDESHQVYKDNGLEAYARYQIEHEDEPLEAGDAFPMVQKLLHLNEGLAGEPRVEVILLSKNSADTGLRVFNSIEHYKLNITRAAFGGGHSPYRYAQAFGCQLFLSTEADDVRNALEHGIAAATLMAPKTSSKNASQLRFAFDGDAVLFSDDAERIFKQEGLSAFTESEKAAAKTPLPGGPFKPFLDALHRLQAEFGDVEDCPIRTALVTARSAPAHERVIRTLRAWNIRIDESLFLGGLPKGEFLKAYGADVFFDDQQAHIDSASAHVATGHVPHGVANTKSVEQKPNSNG